MRIAKRIEDLYRESGCVVFAPGLFVSEQMGADDEVLEALRSLGDEGQLREYDILTCPYRHVLAEGRPGTVVKYMNHHCQVTTCPTNASDADDDDEYENFVFPRFIITSTWRGLLDSEDQKKSPLDHP